MALQMHQKGFLSSGRNVIMSVTFRGECVIATFDTVDSKAFEDIAETLSLRHG